MFAYLSSFFNYLMGKDNKDDDDDDDLVQEHFLAEQLLDLEIGNDNASAQHVDEEKNDETSNICFQRTGKYNSKVCILLITLVG